MYAVAQLFLVLFDVWSIACLRAVMLVWGVSVARRAGRVGDGRQSRLYDNAHMPICLFVLTYLSCGRLRGTRLGLCWRQSGRPGSLRVTTYATISIAKC